jgi:hypothetical protein
LGIVAYAFKPDTSYVDAFLAVCGFDHFFFFAWVRWLSWVMTLGWGSWVMGDGYGIWD